MKMDQIVILVKFTILNQHAGNQSKQSQQFTHIDTIDRKIIVQEKTAYSNYVTQI